MQKSRSRKIQVSKLVCRKRRLECRSPDSSTTALWTSQCLRQWNTSHWIYLHTNIHSASQKSPLKCWGPFIDSKLKHPLHQNNVRFKCHLMLLCYLIFSSSYAYLKTYLNREYFGFCSSIWYKHLVFSIAFSWGQPPLPVISQLIHLCWGLILCLEPWQALSWVDALWGVLTGKKKSSPFVPITMFCPLSSLFFNIIPSWPLNHQWNYSLLPKYPCLFFPQPFLFPHKVDDQMHCPKLCPLAGFFLTVLSLDHSWVRL